jgi:hypothetical protein
MVGHDVVVIRKQEEPVSAILDVNILGKAAVLHFALTPSAAGAVPTQPADYSTQLCFCQVLIGFSYSTPHRRSQL